jgi:hypothetical protein
MGNIFSYGVPPGPRIKKKTAQLSTIDFQKLNGREIP